MHANTYPHSESERDESTIMTIVTEMHGKTFSHGTKTISSNIRDRIILYPFTRCVRMFVYLNPFISFFYFAFHISSLCSVIATLMVPVKLLMNTLIILLEICVKRDASSLAAASKCWLVKNRMICVCCAHVHISPRNCV